jgi:high-affinity iron transporter
MNKQRSLAAMLLLLGGPLVVKATPDDKSAATYKQKCAACHGPDGKGETPTGKALKIQSFARPETAKKNDEELAAIITDGKNKMPKYGSSLKPDEVKALVIYIRGLAK